MGPSLRTDCTISGIAMYSSDLLLMLAYMPPKTEQNTTKNTNETPRRRTGWQGAVQPQLRLIDLETYEQITADTLVLSRFESLTSMDYHLDMLVVPLHEIQKTHRFSLEGLGTGIWEASINAASIFTSAASVRSGSGSESMSRVSGAISAPVQINQLGSIGTKVFVLSPYDCILVTTRDLKDHLEWLLSKERYEESWELINEHPEIVTGDDVPETPTRADDMSVSSVGPKFYSSSEKEKRRVGELWVQQLADQESWKRGGVICGRVLKTADRWEHWFKVFSSKSHMSEIVPYLPTDLKPALSPSVYEEALCYYAEHDRMRLQGLLRKWPSHMFDVNKVALFIKEMLDETEDVTDLTKNRDRKILTESLAKLYTSNNQPRDALPYWMRLKDSEKTIQIVRDFHLIDSISDNIPSFVSIKISDDNLAQLSIVELEEFTYEPIILLANETCSGVIHPEMVVDQLESNNDLLFLFFYLKALWTGLGHLDKPIEARVTEGRSMVERFADLAVQLFAEYNRDLLMELLKTSQAYTFEKATVVCERNDYIPELVYLLAKTGQMKRALFIIIDRLHDVSQAISFAKSQNDPDLWNDLLDYSMDKPKFIRGLLEEVGTAIDPVTLVRRIPEGLEIEGLREGLSRMIREHEIQYSISHGVARVLRGEVYAAMQRLRTGQRKGLRFEVPDGNLEEQQNAVSAPGFCQQCGEPLSESGKLYSSFFHTSPTNY
jgi:hypothetical protein